MNVKKLLAGITALFLAGSSASPAFAEGYMMTDNVFNDNKTSTVTIWKLKENNGDYETGYGTEGENNEGREGIAGVIFRMLYIAEIESVYREEDNSVGLYYTGLTDNFTALADALGVTITPSFTQTETIGAIDPEGEDTVTEVSYYTAEYMTALLEQMKASATADGIDGETYISQTIGSYDSSVNPGFYELPATDENGMTQRTGTGAVLYLVAETDYSGAVLGEDESVYRPSSPFLLQTPMTNTAEVTTTETVDGVETEVVHAPGTLWQTDISVYPKNNTISAGKKIVSTEDDNTLNTSEDVSIGDTVTEVIYSDVPVLDGSVANEKYVIRDTMTDGLTFKGIVSVRLGSRAASADTLDDFSGLTELAPEDYTVSSTEHSFEVSLTETGLAKLDALTSSGQVLVTFQGILNGNAVIGTDPENSNSPEIVWKTSGCTENSLSPSDVKIYTYGIRLTKQGLTDPSKASFRLFIGSTYSYMNFVKEADGVYHLFDGGISDPADAETTTLLCPDSSGNLQIEGLDEQVTYTIEEVTTQSGYQLLKDRIRVTFTANDPKNGDLSSAQITFDNNKQKSEVETENGMVTFSVMNYPTFTLRTGGSGTAAFYLAGAGVLVFAGAFFALGRKKSPR